MSVTLARPGENNLAGSNFDANFRTVFAGEILAAFAQINKMRNLTDRRTIPHGTGADFPTLGYASAYYHVAGATLTGQNIATGKVNIPIDGKLIAPIFIDELEELKNHWDARQQYAMKLAEILSDTYDKNILIEIAKGAAASANLSGLSGGTIEADDTFKVSGDGDGDAATDEAAAVALVQGIKNMATAFDNRKVPERDRHVVLRPTTYNQLAMSLTNGINNSDYSRGGGLNDLYVPPIAGFQIHKHLAVPTTNISQGSAGAITYYHYGDFSKDVGCAFHKSAVGTVELMGLTTEMEWQITEQATLVLAKMAVGHKYKRPEACGVFRTVGT